MRKTFAFLVALATVALAIPAAAAAGGTDWLTYHGTNSRDGFAVSGPPLEHPGRVWRTGVDGSVYAEPLAFGNRIIVATENDSLYALDARTGRVAWRRHVGTPVAGSSLPCGDIDPSGITSTPVVDPARATVYAVAFERPARHFLVAVNAHNGHLRWKRRIDARHSDPRVEQQRGALSLSHGNVYVPYGGLAGDCGDFHGAVVRAPAKGPHGKLHTYTVPAHLEAGIWAPSGAAVDSRGNLFVATGNGDSSSFDFGNAVIKLSPKLKTLGYFAPRNSGVLNAGDVDLGSLGPLLVPGRRVFELGKSGIAYLLNARHLGGVGHPLSAIRACDRAFGADAYAGGVVYASCLDGVVALRVSGSQLNVAWHGPSFSAGGPIVAGGNVWTIDLDAAKLYALSQQTGAVRFSADMGAVAQFSTPTAAGGRVYVGAGSAVESFGG